MAGTQFYRITTQMLVNNSPYYKDNCWAVEMLESLPLDRVLKVESLWGSKVIDDVLYFCKTDGEELEIGGEFVDPEDALETFNLSALSKYIVDKVPKEIYREITDSDLNIGAIDVDNMAIDLINANDFRMVVNDARDLGILE